MFFVALLPLTSGRLAGQEQPPPFSIDDAIELASVISPRISPDGSKVLYTLSKLDWKENERDSRIWIANADGSDPRPFTADVGDTSPRWSPDGRWVAFLRNVGEGDGRARQLFLLRTDGGEARQLTRHPMSVSDVTWARDASRLFYTASDSLATKVRTARKDGDDAVFVDEGPNGQSRSEWSGVWSTSLNFEEVDSRRHTPQGIRVGDYAVSPNGMRIAYTYRTENQRNAGHLGEIALVGTEDGAEAVDLTDNDAPESQLAWSPDGNLLTFVAPSLEGWELDQGNLYAMDPESGEVRELLEGWDGDLRRYEWHPDGGHIELVALERTDTHLFRLDVGSERIDRLFGNTGIIGSPDYSADHSAVVFTLADPVWSHRRWSAGRRPTVWRSKASSIGPRGVAAVPVRSSWRSTAARRACSPVASTPTPNCWPAWDTQCYNPTSEAPPATETPCSGGTWRTSGRATSRT
jgi:Tol biopolymer transport system component